MERFEFPIKILTPIWTAGSSGKPEGLKMSGVMGSMRHCQAPAFWSSCYESFCVS